MPANAIMFFETMIPVVMFDILEELGWLEKLFPDSKDDADPYMLTIRQIRDIGYESFNIFLNLGTISVLCALYIIKLLLMMLVLKPLALFKPSCKDFYRKQKENLLFGEILQIFMNGYMEFLISSMLLNFFAPT